MPSERIEPREESDDSEVREPQRHELSRRALRDVTVRGVRTRVLEAGDDSKPTVLLLHGFLTSHRSWDRVLEPLTADFHVLAPDLPGFGDSEKPNPAIHRYSVDQLAETCADVVSAFGLGRTAVVGHALGGAVALALATDHAELVQRLVLVSPLVYPWAPTPGLRLAMAPVVGSVVVKQLVSRAHFRAFFERYALGEGVESGDERVEAWYESFSTPAGRESALAILRAIADTRPSVARLPRVSVPTLIMWGGKDKLLPVQHAQKVARAIRDSRKELLDTGHSPHDEDPAAFLRVLRAFLDGRR